MFLVKICVAIKIVFSLSVEPGVQCLTIGGISGVNSSCYQFGRITFVFFNREEIFFSKKRDICFFSSYPHIQIYDEEKNDSFKALISTNLLN